LSSRRRHTRFSRDWSADVCSSDLAVVALVSPARATPAPENGTKSPGAPPDRLWRDELPAIRMAEVVRPNRADVSRYSARPRSGENGRASCRERVELMHTSTTLAEH